MDALRELLRTAGPGGLSQDLALWLLGELRPEAAETAGILQDICRILPRPSRELATAILAHFEGTGLLDAAAFQEAVQGASLGESPLGTLLLALCAERWGNAPEAARLFLAVDRDGATGPDSVLLDLARVQARCKRFEEACATLRRAAMASREFGFLSRAARQLIRLEPHARKACARTLRIGLLYPYTTDLWVPLLRLALFREGIWADIHVPSYGTYEQAILDPASTFYAFDPEVVILAPTWRELNLPGFSADPDRAAGECLETLLGRWRLIQGRIPARIIQHTFEIPACDPNGYLGEALPAGRAALIRRINGRLWAEAPAHHVTLLSVEQVAATQGTRAWADTSSWFTAKQYPGPAALPALVDAQVARIRAGLGLTKKVLVLDLDNTLWGGVIGEEGLRGIQVGPPSATGEAHLALQRYASQLKDRGILLAVCSKNNEADAKAPFREHEGMHLHLDDFVAFHANWRDKPSNLREMAQALNLGLDSFVFLDDNPTERALMRQELPQVAVPELGSSPDRYVEILDATGYFEADSLSPEDLERSRNYLNNIQREALKTSAGSLDAFLQGLDMVCERGAVNDHVLARVVQLLGKTNQFNLTTRRHSEAQVRRILEDPGAWTQFFRLKDRFDDNGLVGVLIAVPSATRAGTWEMDTWLMSCRVIGRQLENFMYNTLIQAARERGIQAIHGLFAPTAKNALVERHYQELGFTEIEEAAPGLHRFEILPDSAALRPATFIRDMA